MYTVHVLLLKQPGKVQFAHHARENMRGEEVEIVVWTVKIGRHGSDEVASVLGAIELAHHDPCDLGRNSKVFDPPRNILKAIPKLELVEMHRRKENTWCCGAGGGVRDANKEFALWTAQDRLEEVENVGAEAIVSACPYCRENFSEAINAYSSTPC